MSVDSAISATENDDMTHHWDLIMKQLRKPSDTMERLALWHSTLPCDKLDMIHELGDSFGVFVLSMDCLLHSIRNRFVSRNNLNEVSVQKILFLVNQEITSIIRVKGKDNEISLVFFDSLRPTFNGMWLYARNVLLWWLKLRSSPASTVLRSKGNVSTDIHHRTNVLYQVLSFDSWIADAWNTYTNSTSIAFMMVTDSILNKPRGMTNILEHQEEGEDDDDDDDLSDSMMILRCLLLHVLSKDCIRISLWSHSYTDVHRLMSVSMSADWGDTALLEDTFRDIDISFEGVPIPSDGLGRICLREDVKLINSHLTDSQTFGSLHLTILSQSVTNILKETFDDISDPSDTKRCLSSFFCTIAIASSYSRSERNRNDVFGYEKSVIGSPYDRLISDFFDTLLTEFDDSLNTIFSSHSVPCDTGNETTWTQVDIVSISRFQRLCYLAINSAKPSNGNYVCSLHDFLRDTEHSALECFFERINSTDSRVCLNLSPVIPVSLYELFSISCKCSTEEGVHRSKELVDHQLFPESKKCEIHIITNPSVILHSEHPIVDLIRKTVDPNFVHELEDLSPSPQELREFEKMIFDIEKSSPHDSMEYIKSMDKNRISPGPSASLLLKWSKKPPMVAARLRRQWDERRKQKAHALLDLYSNSIRAVESNHIGIIKESKTGIKECKSSGVQTEKERDKDKVIRKSKKAEEITQKNKDKQLIEQKEKDLEQIKPFLLRSSGFATMDRSPCEFLENELLDIVSGAGRIVNSFDDFGALGKAAKLQESQLIVLATLLKSINLVVKSKLDELFTQKSLVNANKDFQKSQQISSSPVDRVIHISKSYTRNLSSTRKFAARCIKLCHDIIHHYNGEVDEKLMRYIGKLLVMLGFHSLYRDLFELWKVQRLSFLQPSSGTKSLIGPNSSSHLNTKNDKKKNDSKSKGNLKEIVPTDVNPEMNWDQQINDCYVEPKLKKVICSDICSNEHLFMLRYMSEVLDRPCGKDPDPRVRFKPDHWQTELLDIVDRGESVVISAPTASGKTFVSFYAMEKILRMDNEALAVYVAPSRALMTQVFAEARSRFRSKTFPENNTTVLVGNLDEKFQTDSSTCQILVTSPEMFEELLLSESSMDLIKRMKIVIFDEVHCMGDIDTSATWERCIQLIDCPFLALSATIGNPEDLTRWMQKCQLVTNLNSKGEFDCDKVISSNPSKEEKPVVNLIIYSERYNDIWKFVYDPYTAEMCHGKVRTQFAKLRSLHTINCLDYKNVKYGTLPEDFVLLPPESVSLYSAICKLASHYVEFNRNNMKYPGKKEMDPNENDAVNAIENVVNENDITRLIDKLKKLHPTVFFKDTKGVLSKKDFREFEKELKSTFLWAFKDGPLTRDDFHALQRFLWSLNSLDNPESEDAIWDRMMSFIKKLLDYEGLTESHNNNVGFNSSQTTVGSSSVIDTEGESISANTNTATHDAFGMNCSISSEHSLPLPQSSKFYLNQHHLYNLLKDMQKNNMIPCLVFNFDRSEILKMASGLTEYLKKVQYDKYHGSEESSHRTKAENKRRIEKVRKEREQIRLMAKKKSTDDDFELLEDTVPDAVLVEDDYDVECSFCGEKALADEENERMIETLKRKGVNTAVVDALKRGIGIHHPGLSFAVRSTTEILFRRGYLTVVISASTCALGLHMPCKSTVLTGSWVELNALMYKQISGRAGRRGYDLRGNVVFCGLPMAHIRALHSSQLSNLTGDLSTTPETLVKLVHRQVVGREELYSSHGPDGGCIGEEEEDETVFRDRSSLLTALAVPLHGMSSRVMFIYHRMMLDWLMKRGFILDSSVLDGFVPIKANLLVALRNEPALAFVAHGILSSPSLVRMVQEWRDREKRCSRQVKTETAYYMMANLLAYFIQPRMSLYFAALRQAKDYPWEVPSRRATSYPLLEFVDKRDEDPCSKKIREFSRDVIRRHNSDILLQTQRVISEIKKTSTGEHDVSSQTLNSLDVTFPLNDKETEDEMTIRHRSCRNDMHENENDRFTDLKELLTETVGSEYISRSMIPMIEIVPAEMGFWNSCNSDIDDKGIINVCRTDDSTCLLSSYILCFLVHGSLDRITCDYHIPSSSIWSILMNWKSALERIVLFPVKVDADNVSNICVYEVIEELKNEIEIRIKRVDHTGSS